MSTATHTDTSTGTTLAEEYNASAVEYLRTFGIAAEYVSDLADGVANNEETGDALDITEWALSKGYSDDDVHGAAVIARSELLECDTEDEAWLVYVDGALAIEATGKHDGREWRVTGVEVTLTYGGPNTWLTWNGNRSDYVTVTTVYGYGRVSTTVEAPVLVSVLSWWADELEG